MYLSETDDNMFVMLSYIPQSEVHNQGSQLIQSLYD